MAWYRCGGGGVPASVKTDMNAVLNKKFGTSTDYPPADWAPTVNLMGPLPEKTQASASVCSFSDGADDVPTKSLVVTIPPTLSGVSSVSEAQTGKNLLPPTYFENFPTKYTVNADGSITVNGSEDSAWSSMPEIPIKAGTYTLSRGLTGSACYIRTALDNYASNVCAIYNARTEASFTVASDTYFKIKIGTGGTYPFTDNYMLEVGSTATAYEPYQTPTTYTASLGRTIYGGTADIVNGTGKSSYGNIDMGTLTWQYDSANTRFFTVGLTSVIKRGTSGWITDLEVDAPYTVASGTQNDKTISEYASTGYVYIKDTDYTDTTAFKASLSGKYLTYPLATPTDFTFTGQEINTRLGYNAFWSDEGDTEVTYRADIDLLLGGN